MSDLREEIERIYEDAFPEEVCRKFSGALTVELMRKRQHSIRPTHNVLYRLQDVAAVLEVKYRGSFGSDALERTRANFQRIKQFDSQIPLMGHAGGRRRDSSLRSE